MDDNLRAFLSSPTAFRIESDTHFAPPHVCCRSCLSQIVFELGMQPDDEAILITPLHAWSEIGARSCPDCEESYR